MSGNDRPRAWRPSFSLHRRHLIGTLVSWLLAGGAAGQQAGPVDHDCSPSLPAPVPAPTSCSDEEREGHGLVCTLSSGKSTYVLGETPKVQVRIKNCSASDVYLVGSLDASEVGWRFPHCLFYINGALPNLGGRCGNTNALDQADFVKVAPGTEFDPFAGRFFGEYVFSEYVVESVFPAAGQYRVRFVYDANEQRFAKWYGGWGADPGDDEELAALQSLLDKVPKVTLRSNELVLRFDDPASLPRAKATEGAQDHPSPVDPKEPGRP